MFRVGITHIPDRFENGERVHGIYPNHLRGVPGKEILLIAMRPDGYWSAFTPDGREVPEIRDNPKVMGRPPGTTVQRKAARDVTMNLLERLPAGRKYMLAAGITSGPELRDRTVIQMHRRIERAVERSGRGVRAYQHPAPGLDLSRATAAEEIPVERINAVRARELERQR